MVFGDEIDWENHIKEIFDSGDTVYYGKETGLEKLNRIKKHKTSGKLLDCGCHIGRWINRFKENGYDYVGIDQSERAIKVAKEHIPDGTFIHSFLWDMTFTEEFDVVHTNAVLQHNTLEEQELIMPKICQALRPGGILVITESTVDLQTKTQRTYEGWIDLASRNGLKFIESWHKNELGLDENYLFLKS